MTRRTFLLAAAGAALGAAIAPLLSASGVGAGEVTQATMRARLTQEELEVLRLLVDGKNEKQIRQELGMPKYQLRSHVMNILQKLQVHSRLATATESLRPRT